MSGGYATSSLLQAFGSPASRLRDPVFKLLGASEILLPCGENKHFHILNFWGTDVREKRRLDRLKKREEEEEEKKNNLQRRIWNP